MLIDNETFVPGTVTETQNERLARLIREGCAHRPQSVGSTLTLKGSCALGAAYEAYHGEIREWVDFITVKAWVKGQFPGIDINEVTVLNDVDGMSREQIADRIENGGCKQC